MEKKAQNNGSGRAAMTCFSASFRIKESKMWMTSVPKSEIEEVGVGRIESMSNLLLSDFMCFLLYQLGRMMVRLCGWKCAWLGSV